MKYLQVAIYYSKDFQRLREALASLGTQNNSENAESTTTHAVGLPVASGVQDIIAVFGDFPAENKKRWNCGEGQSIGGVCAFVHFDILHCLLHGWL